ncbi:MAG: hypothetical protein Q9224_006992, partial [Gallowayella concinna]
CSGTTRSTILHENSPDEPRDNGRNGIRPRGGAAPEFITLTMGGNGVGILNLVATCIYSLNPFGQDCAQVIGGGHKELEKPALAANAKKMIQTFLDKGRETSVGDNFARFRVR